MTQLCGRIPRPVRSCATIPGAVAATVLLGIYLLVRPALGELEPLPIDRHIIRARTRGEAASSTEKTADAEPPYRLDEFPGARQLRTSYGTMQVFEWGPEDGEKVLLIHGIGTPCIALGDMAREFVAKGFRVMLFDLFGRGYSDAPADLPYDDRLYTTQILLGLSSSPLPWTGSSVFHILGFSLGGAIAASFATYHANMLRSATLVCPAGLVRPAHISWSSRLAFILGDHIPEFLVQRLVRRRLRPSSSQHSSVDIPDGAEDADVDFNAVPVGGRTIGEVVRWQFDGNDGFVPAFVSTIRNAPIYAQHKTLWPRLAEALAVRRRQPVDGEAAERRPVGMSTGRICLIVADKDPIIVGAECVEDTRAILGEDGVDAYILKGGHEIAISRGKEIANIAIESWTKFRKE
ncbi:alpha/beta hydrolase [Cordyceps fumosorosea ARSEF 2679]|uniref:Alpha/beta hydrolase n=1 Tax=Cordyceps fumosorosea (strain ARSEF 2679) TaxID=1081104 RepID=A0A167P9S5_CORFA|nr:alpha/beta hydrolase [Cordyceps fumosorosea ARSEF 2679]OAA56436.1 alpha/beta hydrolase [Cordyceps fumosorosea ARSEF 2679]